MDLPQLGFRQDTLTNSCDRSHGIAKDYGHWGPQVMLQMTTKPSTAAQGQGGGVSLPEPPNTTAKGAGEGGGNIQATIRTVAIPATLNTRAVAPPWSLISTGTVGLGLSRKEELLSAPLSSRF